ncbi:MAG TPA: DUF4058 family protein [Tepidisphaeraceae bacterium]|jgi:hypothetical protein|nr:DUF4058 family protein [Tepidisphaeraceae bacterium]
MPLHDWSDLQGWEGVRLLWLAELLRQVKGVLPAGFRAYLGSGPAMAVGAPRGRPDVAVRSHGFDQPEPGAAGWRSTDSSSVAPDPDVEIAVATLDPDPALLVERDGQLIAAVELVSPRNKDRPLARTTYLNRYAGYLIEGVHLLLVDVHRRPAGFSFADGIAAELQIPGQPALPAPMAVSYRVGQPAATGGRLLAIWRRPLSPGQPLPPLPLPLTLDLAVQVELEPTYSRAAADAYLA